VWLEKDAQGASDSGESATSGSRELTLRAMWTGRQPDSPHTTDAEWLILNERSTQYRPSSRVGGCSGGKAAELMRRSWFGRTHEECRCT
jgi:hypothetical protein